MAIRRPDLELSKARRQPTALNDTSGRSIVLGRFVLTDRLTEKRPRGIKKQELRTALRKSVRLRNIFSFGEQAQSKYNLAKENALHTPSGNARSKNVWHPSLLYYKS